MEFNDLLNVIKIIVLIVVLSPIIWIIYKVVTVKNSPVSEDGYLNNENKYWISFPAIYFYDWDSYSYFDDYDELLSDLEWGDDEYINNFYFVDSNFKKYKARLINEIDFEFYFTNETIKFEELKQLILNLDWKDILESKDFNELIDNI